MAARRVKPRLAAAPSGHGDPVPSLELADRLDTAEARTLAAALLSRRGAPISIDASRVARLGAQCAQVLLSARMTWARDGHPFEITASSEGFGDGLRLLGLAGEFGVTSA